MYTEKTIHNLAKDLLAMGGSSGQGVLPQMRKIHKYLRAEHGKRFRAHVTPDGSKWQPALVRQKTAEYKIPHIGGGGPIRLVGAPDDWRNVRYGKIKSQHQLARSIGLTAILNGKRHKRDKYAPALYRPSGPFSTKGNVTQSSWKKDKVSKVSIETKTQIQVAGVLYGMMTKDKVAGAAGGPKKWGLEYGLGSSASAWAYKLHFGGAWRKGKIPPRPFIGMNRANVKHIVNYLMQAINDKAGRLGISEAI